MKLYFVRHGKTQWNVEGRFQGAGADSPLLEEAILELKDLGRYLSKVNFDAVFSSDLKRAQLTAQIIMDENLNPKPVGYSSDLQEWRLGKLEGTKIATMEATYPEQMAAFRDNLAQFDAAMFEAESVHQTTQRVADFVASLKDKSYDKVLLVGHGANFTAATRALLGYDVADLRAAGGLDNASVTILETTDYQHYSCLSWNDKSYVTDKQLRLTT